MSNKYLNYKYNPYNAQERADQFYQWINEKTKFEYQNRCIVLWPKCILAHAFAWLKLKKNTKKWGHLYLINNAAITIKLMAVWSIYKSGSSSIYIYSQEVRILQNELKFQKCKNTFFDVNNFWTSQFSKKSNRPPNGITLLIYKVFDLKHFWRFSALRTDTSSHGILANTFERELMC